MRILLAPDSFKESASAEAIAQAMVRGIKRGNPQAECRLMPLSDGGEGLTQALVHATGGTLHNVETVDAIGRPITAQFGFLGNNHASCILHTAVVELASASGLERVSPADRNALAASTFGTGLLIRAAIDAGADRIVLGLGGSATTDGGTGLLARLDFVFLIRQVMIFRLVAVLLLICRGLTIRKFPIPSKKRSDCSRLRRHQSFDRPGRCRPCVRPAKRRDRNTGRASRSGACESRARNHAI
mgnify:CR=1 FL=1